MTNVMPGMVNCGTHLINYATTAHAAVGIRSGIHVNALSPDTVQLPDPL